MREYESLILGAISRRQALEKLYSEKEQLQIKTEKEMEIVLEARSFLQSLAKTTQEMFSVKLSTIVDMALDICFPGRYTFSTVYSAMRGKTECCFELTDKTTGQVITDILNSTGGGLVDVVCFALRIGLYSITKPDNVLLLDEPFRFMSQSLQPKMAEFVSMLSHKLGLQIIMTTHLNSFIDCADAIYEVSLDDNVSIIDRKEN